MAGRTRRAWLVGLLLGGAVAGLYLPALGLPFSNFDDDDYVSRNPRVLAGLTAGGARWAVTSRDEVNWHPLTWLSLQFDAHLFGPGPVGFHHTNILLHAANTVLLFALLCRATGALWPSAAAAACFGVHPVHVEAVAWVTARKDVLSTLFGFLAVAAYVRYARRPGAGRYLLVAVPFALSLAAKQMLVTLPAALLLLDYWPLGRWPGRGGAGLAPATGRRLVLEKLPLLALAVPAAGLTLWAQAPIIHDLAGYTAYDRVANALVSYVAYLRMLVWPADLAILYPLPRRLPVWQPVLAFALLAAVTAGVVRARRSRPYLAVGWFWFLGTLVPVIGLVQNGPQARADRYAYVPYVGLYVAAAWAAAGAGTPGRRRAAVLAGGAALLACAAAARHQMGYWRGNEELWRHALAATADNAGAHTMLGKTLLDAGDYPGAVDEFEAALRLDPDNVATLGNAGVALLVLGRADEAAGHLERSARLRPDHAATRFNLGTARERQGRPADALAEYAAALARDPGLTAAGAARAGLLTRQGDFAAARAEIDRLLAADPDAPAAHAEAGRLFAREKRYADAAASYDRVLAARPDAADAWTGKGFALERLGRLADAAGCYRRAAELRPGELAYRLNRAYAEGELGNAAAAAEEYRAAFALRPDWPAATLADARVLATHPDAARRDGALALRAATLVCRLTADRMPQAVDAQAAAYAELGEFAEAAARQRRVLELLGPDAPPDLRAAVADRLRLYEQRQPFRQEP